MPAFSMTLAEAVFPTKKRAQIPLRLSFLEAEVNL